MIQIVQKHTDKDNGERAWNTTNEKIWMSGWVCKQEITATLWVLELMIQKLSNFELRGRIHRTLPEQSISIPLRGGA